MNVLARPLVLASKLEAPRTILVTGSTDGIGRETALQLARNPAHAMIVHGRSQERTNAAVDMIRKESGNPKVEGVVADFGDLSDVREMAAELCDRYESINSIVLNAGRLMPSREVSKDGLEMTWAVNHYAHFLLTGLLMDKVIASGTESLQSRIVAVSSMCHSWEEMSWDDLNCERRDFSTYDIYSQTKLANVLFTLELARRLRAAGVPVASNSIEPGVVETKLLRVGGYSGGPVSVGARPSVYLAADPDLEGVTGKYYSAGCEEETPDRKARDEASQARMWQISEEVCGLTFMPEHAR